MSLAKSILHGATALVIFAGSAAAQPITNVSTIYEVDEDRDGRTDRLLILEHSDNLA